MILNIRPILSATGVDKNSDVIDCAGLEQLFIVTQIAATVALAGTTFTLVAPFDQNSDLATAPPLQGAVAVSPDGNGYAFTAGGVLTPTGVPASSYFTIRVPFPPRYVALRYDYGSGGGTLAVNVYAYGNSYGPNA